MTGFPRPGRSYYLDDLNLAVGALVKCVCDLVGDNFTQNKVYTVQENGQLRDDKGHLVVPSARFQPLS